LALDRRQVFFDAVAILTFAHSVVIGQHSGVLWRAAADSPVIQINDP